MATDKSLPNVNATFTVVFQNHAGNVLRAEIPGYSILGMPANGFVPEAGKTYEVKISGFYRDNVYAILAPA